MKKLISFIAACILIGLNTNTFAQGCSDAGFCTIGNLGIHKANVADGSRHRIAVLLPIGKGDQEVLVVNPAIEYILQYSPKWAFQGKLTANYASGNLGSTSGLGDVYLSGTYMLNPAAKWKTSVTIGTKFPLNQSNLRENNLSLPLQYQSSLGTVDLITGIATVSNHWQFAAGWQQPLTGRNRNNFLPAYWDKPSAKNYPPSNDFNRKGDVLIRSVYAFPVKKTWQLNAGLLAIYHLGKDTYIDANVSNLPIAITGSEGLTLNATVAANIQVNKKLSIGFTGGVPLVVRDVRPDGLTRRFVFSPEINFKF